MTESLVKPVVNGFIKPEYVARPNTRRILDLPSALPFSKQDIVMISKLTYSPRSITNYVRSLKFYCPYNSHAHSLLSTKTTTCDIHHHYMTYPTLSTCVAHLTLMQGIKHIPLFLAVHHSHTPVNQ